MNLILKLTDTLFSEIEAWDYSKIENKRLFEILQNNRGTGTNN